MELMEIEFQVWVGRSKHLDECYIISIKLLGYQVDVIKFFDDGYNKVKNDDIIMNGCKHYNK
ncbi:hypothetical protein PIROE2DRAFT_7719 [Piromyces sp. E2]|nr:hypothetical protein PIROE2DRAFT_7719 [Piromyces sp. E2]|eukprot:OUM65262.1 hypothetical protein PIROE2DRAFT_7719 [Piromyces sp. E2]